MCYCAGCFLVFIIYCHSFCRMIIFNVSALQEEGIYQVGKGYLYSLLLLVVCDWWRWGLSVVGGHVWGYGKSLGDFCHRLTGLIAG